MARLFRGLHRHRGRRGERRDARARLGGPYGTCIDADAKDPNAYVLRLHQSGLGLPDRDYHLRSDKEIIETRATYVRCLTTMLEVAGIAHADVRAGAVFALEVEIAKAQWPAADRFDTYEPLPGIRIHGQLTLGENIADLAGLVIACKAYPIAVAGEPAPLAIGRNTSAVVWSRRGAVRTGVEQNIRAQ